MRLQRPGDHVNLEFSRLEVVSEISTRGHMPSRGRLRRRLFLGLFLLDTSCILAGFLLAALLYKPAAEEHHWLMVASIILPVFFIAALNGRAYSADVIANPGRGTARALQALLASAITVLFIAFYLKSSDHFSRVTTAIGFTASLIFLGLARDTVLRHASRLLGGNPFQVILIRDGDHPVDTRGFSLVIADPRLDPDDHCPAMYDRLAHALKDADRVIIACPPERRMSWASALKGASVRSEIIVPELQHLAPLSVDHWYNATTLVVADGPLGKVDAFLKRTFDIAASGAALIILSPVLLAVALLIKLESAGPVFFIQSRIGQGNGMFRMLKFRSMRVEQCDALGNASTARDDDRITRVGSIIRKTSIDELPQLLNVLKGDMSIVGPRPHALGSRAENKLFWEIDGRYWHRHAAKPGLTGLAQVRGFRGATDHESDLTNRLQADLEYLSEWSIWKDIKIIFLTFKVLVHKNAY